MAMLALLSHFRDIDGLIGEWKLVLSCCCFGPHKSRERKERKSKQGEKKEDEERAPGREKKNTERMKENEWERENEDFSTH